MSYQCLKLNGSGYASVADASQAGLDMGLSDFMVEVRVKLTVPAASQPDPNTYFFSKYAIGITYYEAYLVGGSEALFFTISNMVDTAWIRCNTSYIDDLKWHSLLFVADRDNTTGLKLFIDGVEVIYEEQFDPIPVGDLDNTGEFTIGAEPDTHNHKLNGLIDEVRVWNFGYGGLPADYATYIAWRAQGRNVFKDISEYNNGSWNCYADADRTEQLTDGGLENWTGDLLDDWVEEALSAGVRDLFDENGTGGGNIHGGSHAAKLMATGSDGIIDFSIYQPLTLEANKYYEAIWWQRYASRIQGTAIRHVFNTTDGNLVFAGTSGVEATYTQHLSIFKPTVESSRIYCRLFNETTGIVYFDDISVKRVGLVGHWKFEGDYLDEGSNDNDLTAGGSGNAFPGYTLKKDKIIRPGIIGIR